MKRLKEPLICVNYVLPLYFEIAQSIRYLFSIEIFPKINSFINFFKLEGVFVCFDVSKVSRCSKSKQENIFKSLCFICVAFIVFHSQTASWCTMLQKIKESWLSQTFLHSMEFKMKFFQRMLRQIYRIFLVKFAQHSKSWEGIEPIYSKK